MIHVYTGDGKGKTTAAVGLAVRHAGTGGSVLFVQFLKCTPSGEITAFASIPGVTVLRNDIRHGFTFNMSDADKARVTASHDANLACAVETVRAGGCTMLVLDEITSAYALDLIDRAAVDALLDDLPDAVELVLTGREPSRHMLDAADYVTEMKLIKHPYTRGVQARRGVEF